MKQYRKWVLNVVFINSSNHRSIFKITDQHQPRTAWDCSSNNETNISNVSNKDINVDRPIDFKPTHAIESLIVLVLYDHLFKKSQDCRLIAMRFGSSNEIFANAI